jgi:hypothetical protein
MKVARMLSIMVVKHYIPLTKKIDTKFYGFFYQNHTHTHLIAQKRIVSFEIA